MANDEIGSLCVKLAGRDAGKECVIVKKLSDTMVMVDGNTRRRKCNILHLEFLNKKLNIKEDASHDEVMKALESFGVKAVKRVGPKAKKEAKPEATTNKKAAKPKKPKA